MKFTSPIVPGLIASLIVTAIIGTTAFYVQKDIRYETKRFKTIEQITAKSSQLNILLASTNNTSYPSDYEQLNNTQQSLHELLEDLDSAYPEEQRIINSLTQSSHSLAKEFGSFMALQQLPQGANLGLQSRIIETKLWSEIRHISDQSIWLYQMSQERIDAALDRADTNLILLLASLLVSNALISFFSLRRIQSSELALREKEERYKATFHDARDGMALVEIETGLIRECNDALCSLSGRPRTALVGYPAVILHPQLELRSSDGFTHTDITVAPQELSLRSKNGDLNTWTSFPHPFLSKVKSTH